ncbi:hypothetical protein, partial [Romboutsia ilealis]|uniref:hypothetical protein n=1 Tax=Romboutsia ilealis TaxID=1115758 RepID=UPI00272C96E0
DFRRGKAVPAVYFIRKLFPAVFSKFIFQFLLLISANKFAAAAFHKAWAAASADILAFLIIEFS